MKKRIKTREDISGREYGFLTVISQYGFKGKKRIWKCLCVCNNEVLSNSNELVSGKRYSCGCKSKGKERSTFKGYEEISGSWFTRAIQSAKKRNLIWEISIQDIWEQYLLQDKKCSMTGWPIICKRSRDTKGASASLDRIDNTKGYTKDNIQLVHANVNLARHKMSINDFLQVCKLVTTGANINDKIAWI